MRTLRILIAYSLFIGIVALFANGPTYHLLKPDMAVLSLTFSHAGARISECRTLSQAELNELPPNMRKPVDCPRERHSVEVNVSANGELLIADTLPPSGIWNDGKANVYRRITLPAGNYQLGLAMDDNGSASGGERSQTANIELLPGQNLVVSFDELTGAFTLE